MKVYLNGEIKDSQSIVDMFEPGFLFGWGVFETLRVYNKVAVFLNEHLKRLEKGAKNIDLDFPAVDFSSQINSLLEENKLAEAYCRITLFKKRKSTGVIIYVSNFEYYNLDDYEKGFKAIIAPFKRYSDDFLTGVKSTSYLHSRFAWKKAQDREVDEAVFLNENNFLSEGTRTNLFFIKNNKIFTPSIDCGILSGITREKVIEVIKKEGLELIEGEFSLDKLKSADEAFLTSSLMEIMPLVEIDQEQIGSKRMGRITEVLLNGYRKLIKEQSNG